MKPFTTIGALLFIAVAVIHDRIYAGIPIMADGHEIPMVASWIALAVTGIIGLMMFMEARR
jgi:hypothetical protein